MKLFDILSTLQHTEFEVTKIAGVSERLDEQRQTGVLESCTWTKACEVLALNPPAKELRNF